MRQLINKRLGFTMLGLAMTLVLVLSACTGPVGPAGAPGTPGTAGASTGVLSGKITNSLTKAGLSGVDVTIDPAIPNVTIKSDASGAYTAELPIGVYTITYKKTSFDNATQTASIVAKQTITRDVALKPTKAVNVSAGAAVTSKPDGTVTLKATAETFDGSTVQSFEWTQVSGVQTVMANNKTDTLTVTLPKAAAYKYELTQELEVLERIRVVGINPHLLAAAETTQYKVTVTTSSGKYTATVNVVADMPFTDSTGLPVVPKAVAVLIQGKTQATYNWTLTTVPTDSKATVLDGTTQYPYFTPDVVGKYTLTETVSKATLDVYAGTWSSGAVSGLDAKGNPTSTGCTICHDGKTASNNFTEWAASGHAEIFQQNVDNPAGHWTESCALCHTVGYNKNATNNGWDEAMAAEKWVVPSHGDVGYFKMMLEKYPKTASQANIQCENCHGPNDGTGLHPNKVYDTARISLSADVCGSCHGEPPRHGRFQQWEETGHGNFELAIDESGSASCIRCHTGQGFLLWLQQGTQYGDLNRSIQGASGNATSAEVAKIVTRETAVPITCAVCHDPHKLGTASGEPNDVVLRVQGSTPLLPSGYKAVDVGNGALCITCHNTRNGLKTDATVLTSYGGPHYSSQGDVLLGYNAFFVSTPSRSPHAAIKNTCTACHMEATPPPAEFSYNGAGTNHDFAASLTICKDCHTSQLNAKAFQLAEEEKIKALADAMGKYLLNKITTVTVKDYAVHTYSGKEYDVKSNGLVISKSDIVGVEAAHVHGQQAFKFTLKAPVSVTYAPTGENPHTMSVTTLEVQLGDITTDGTKALIALTDPLLRVGWNLSLLESDGSGGIHNPAFAEEVLNASLAALK